MCVRVCAPGGKEFPPPGFDVVFAGTVMKWASQARV